MEDQSHIDPEVNETTKEVRSIKPTPIKFQLIVIIAIVAVSLLFLITSYNYFKGVALIEQKEWRNAITQLSKYEEGDWYYKKAQEQIRLANNSLAKQLLGNAKTMLNANYPGDAEFYLLEALKIDPNLQEAKELLAQAQAESEQAEAIRAKQKAEEERIEAARRAENETNNYEKDINALKGHLYAARTNERLIATYFSDFTAENRLRYQEDINKAILEWREEEQRHIDAYNSTALNVPQSLLLQNNLPLRLSIGDQYVTNYN